MFAFTACRRRVVREYKPPANVAVTRINAANMENPRVMLDRLEKLYHSDVPIPETMRGK
jgi:hypothetical protein